MVEKRKGVNLMKHLTKRMCAFFFALLMLQIVTGVLVYAGASMAFKVPAFGMLLGMAKKMLKKKTA